MNNFEYNKTYYPISVIKNTIDSQIDDVFITSSSFEERCLGSINLLHHNYNAKYVYLFNYTGLDKNKIRRTHIKKMRNRLKKIGFFNEIRIDPSKPIYILSEITKSIINNFDEKHSPTIKIDITTFMKWHILILLKLLDQKNLINNITFIYTEPEEYSTDLFQPLSFGINEIFPIPFYYGDYDYSKDNLLALFLGYEGNRALALFEKLDPDECLLFIPDPPYWEQWKNKTEEMNHDIINLLGKKRIRFVHSRNPNIVCDQIKKYLLDKQYKKYNHIISPLGTKPQTLGLYFYLKKYNPNNTILTYASPLRYNELFYSKGIGRTWGLHI